MSTTQTMTVTVGRTPVERRCYCQECDWHGEVGVEVDVIHDPKPGSETVWEICPQCRAADSLYMACDEPGCWKPVDCGTPTLTGYRSTCSKHAPRTTR